MNHRRLLELFWEFSNFIERLHTLYLDSLVGYSILHERLLDHQSTIMNFLEGSELATKEFQDTCSILYKHISNRDFTPVSMSPVMKQGDIKQRVRDDGENTLLLGRQCVVSAYAYWEEYLRLEIGKAIGALPDDAVACDTTRDILNKSVKSDFWGDIRYIRNSIVHSNGVASSDIAKCKVFKWFSAGEDIKLTHEKMRIIFLGMGCYRNEIHQMSLPERALRLPLSLNNQIDRQN